jgi:hypothetical protein
MSERIRELLIAWLWPALRPLIVALLDERRPPPADAPTRPQRQYFGGGRHDAP